MWESSRKRARRGAGWQGCGAPGRQEEGLLVVGEVNGEEQGQRAPPARMQWDLAGLPRALRQPPFSLPDLLTLPRVTPGGGAPLPGRPCSWAVPQAPRGRQSHGTSTWSWRAPPFRRPSLLAGHHPLPPPTQGLMQDPELQVPGSEWHIQELGRPREGKPRAREGERGRGTWNGIAPTPDEDQAGPQGGWIPRNEGDGPAGAPGDSPCGLTPWPWPRAARTTLRWQ